MAQQLLDRLGEIRTPCPVVAELGSGSGSLVSRWRGEAGARLWLQVDLSERALRRAAERDGAGAGSPAAAASGPAVPEDEEDDEEMLALMRSEEEEAASAAARGLRVVRVCGDAERLPLAEGSVDAVVSVLDLHWTNDVEAALQQARRALRPDGLFLAVLLGGETGHELTTSLVAAETERRGGVSTRSSPMMHVPDAGALLQAAGFALPAVDTGFVQVEYGNAAEAMTALGAMGESAAPAGSEGPSLGSGGARDTLLAAAAVMQWRHGGAAMTEEEADQGAADPRTREPEAERRRLAERGAAGAEEEEEEEEELDADTARRMASGVPLTFQTVWLNGFAPSATQQRPLKRGSVPHGFATHGSGATPDLPTQAGGERAEEDGAGAPTGPGRPADSPPADDEPAMPDYPGMPRGGGA